MSFSSCICSYCVHITLYCNDLFDSRHIFSPLKTGVYIVCFTPPLCQDSSSTWLLILCKYFYYILFICGYLWTAGVVVDCTPRCILGSQRTTFRTQFSLLRCGIPGSNSGHQALWKASLPTELPSLWPCEHFWIHELGLDIGASRKWWCLNLVGTPCLGRWDPQEKIQM